MEQARREYVQGRESLTALARRYPRLDICGQASRENWTARRREYRRQRRRMARVDTLADELLGCLERSVGQLSAITVTCKEKSKNKDSESSTEYEKPLPGEEGLIDRGGLKQLTGVLKDLKDILSLQSEADTREQEIRIAKITRELQGKEAAAVEVTLEEEVAAYAD